MDNVIQLRPSPPDRDDYACRQALAFGARLEAACAQPGFTGADASYVATRVFAVMAAEYMGLLRINGADRELMEDMAGAIANAVDGGLLAGMEAELEGGGDG